MSISRMTVTFDNFNHAAISDDPSHEVSSVLRELADQIERGSIDQDGAILRDSNGAPVGTVRCDFDNDE